MKFTTTDCVEPDAETWIEGVSVTVDRPATVTVTVEDVENAPVQIVVRVDD